MYLGYVLLTLRQVWKRFDGDGDFPKEKLADEVVLKHEPKNKQGKPSSTFRIDPIQVFLDKDMLRVNLLARGRQEVDIRIVNEIAGLIYHQRVEADKFEQLAVSMSRWSKGKYTIHLLNEQNGEFTSGEFEI